MPPSRVDRSAALVLLLAIGAAYFGALAGTAPVAGQVALAGGPAPATLGAWLAAQPGPRPLLTLSYALNETSGLGVAGWRAVNVLVHTVASLLAYAVLRRLTHREDIVFRDQRLAAFLASAAFALHPVQTDAVTALSGRSASLAALFALMAMLLWLRGREYDDRRDLYLRSPLAFVAALLCNEQVIVLPLGLLLAARLQSHRGWWVRIALRESAMHWLIAVAAIGAALAAPRYREFVLGNFGAQDIATELVMRANAMLRLAGHLVRPDQVDAGPVLDLPAGIDAAGIASAAAICLSLLAGLVSLRRYPVLAFAILWFLLWLVPSIVFTPRPGVTADRQLYLALVGPALGTARLLLRLSPRLVQWALVPVLLAGLAFATHQRNAVHLQSAAAVTGPPEGAVLAQAAVIAGAPANGEPVAALSFDLSRTLPAGRVPARP